MSSKIAVRLLLMWLVFMIAAILNGVFREAVITPNMDAYTGHVISTFMLISLIILGTYLFLKFWLREFSNRQTLQIGLIWLMLTVSFEFLFGHYVTGHSWAYLLADYNFFKGRLWSLILLVTVLSPYLIGRTIPNG